MYSPVYEYADVREQPPTGFYVMNQYGNVVMWRRTKTEADMEAMRLNNQGVRVTTVPSY